MKRYLSWLRANWDWCCCVFCVIIVCTGWLYAAIFQPERNANRQPSAAEELPMLEVTVEIKGAVISPGIYTMDKGMRVQDLVQTAGGLTNDADTDKVNMAEVLTDGDMVHIPFAEE